MGKKERNRRVHQSTKIDLKGVGAPAEQFVSLIWSPLYVFEPTGKTGIVWAEAAEVH